MRNVHTKDMYMIKNHGQFPYTTFGAYFYQAFASRGGGHILSQFYPAPSLPFADFTQPPTSPYDFYPLSSTSLAFLCRSRLPNALCPPSAYPNNLSLGHENDPLGGLAAALFPSYSYQTDRHPTSLFTLVDH